MMREYHQFLVCIFNKLSDVFECGRNLCESYQMSHLSHCCQDLHSTDILCFFLIPSNKFLDCFVVDFLLFWVHLDIHLSAIDQWKFFQDFRSLTPNQDVFRELLELWNTTNATFFLILTLPVVTNPITLEVFLRIELRGIEHIQHWE